MVQEGSRVSRGLYRTEDREKDELKFSKKTIA